MCSSVAKPVRLSGSVSWDFTEGNPDKHGNVSALHLTTRISETLMLSLRSLPSNPGYCQRLRHNNSTILRSEHRETPKNCTATVGQAPRLSMQGYDGCALRHKASRLNVGVWTFGARAVSLCIVRIRSLGFEGPGDMQA